MAKWFQERKKQVIIAIIVAGLSAAVPTLPPSIVAPLVNAIYALIEGAPAEVVP